MAEQILTQEYLHTVFTYKNGHLYWKKTGTGIVKEQAGWQDKLGYWNLGLNKKTYKIHRLIYLMHHGFMPKCIDHIDNNALNNAIENLREATLSENQFNSKTHKNSTTKIKNVTYLQESGKYRVTLALNKSKKHFGYYDDLELAELVAIEARDKYHGRFARHG
jgi:hypothetical protein